MITPLVLLGVFTSLTAAQTPPTISLSAGFSDDAVLQRSAESGAKVYGFVAANAPVTVKVSNRAGAPPTYTVGDGCVVGEQLWLHADAAAQQNDGWVQ